jgi:hypothetical protein
VAIERTILTAVWNMLTYHAAYADLGGDYYTRRDPVRAKYKAIRQLQALGYQVTVQPAVA